MSDSDLPQSWSWIPLGELIQPIMTRDPSQESNIEITYFDIGSIDNELGVVADPMRVLSSKAPSRARQVVKPGDVLFSTVRPYLRGIAQVPLTENGVASTGFCVLRPEGSISAKYLYYLVRSDEFLDGLLPLQRGVSYPAVREIDVLTQLIPVAPIAEQNRIVEKLDELLSGIDTGVNELKAAQNKLANYWQALLKAAVEGTLTAEWRAQCTRRDAATESGPPLLARILTERRAHWEATQLAKFKEQGKIPPKNWRDKYPHPLKPDITDLPTLPEGWVWTNLDQLSFIVRGASPRPAGDPKYFGGNIPWITVGSLTADNEIYLDSVDQFVTEAGKKASRYIEPATLLLTNSGATLGVPKITRIGGCINDGSVALLGIDEPLKLYLYFFLTTQTKALRLLNQGAAQPNLNTDIVRRITVPICTFDELAQINHQLVDALHEIKQQATTFESLLKQSAAQRKNILKAAFSGQLVPQDPDDEPVSVLLNRISDERKVREGQPKPRKIKIKKEISAMATKLKDVLADAGDWISAQEAFRRCGVANSAHTDQVEALYAELRVLDKSNQLAVESVKDAQGRKLYDQLKLIVTT